MRYSLREFIVLPPLPSLPTTGTPQSSRWAIVIAVALAMSQASGVLNLAKNPIIGPDYIEASSYVASHRLPGEPIVVAVPAAAYLKVESTADMLFLPGTVEGRRAQRYARILDSGQIVDYWLGVPAITSTAALCELLDESPNLWLIVDETRLHADWALAGPMADVIQARSSIVFSGRGGVSVRRPLPPSLSTTESLTLCGIEPSAT
jgi:hypothetical protein